jgi:hypothetical protein
MVRKAQKVILAGMVVAGLAAYVNGCAIIGTLDFNVKFRPAGAPCAVDCSVAAVPNVRFQFFDQALDNLLRTEATRPCVPNERYRVSIDLGPYNIRVQGINGQLTVCYETNQLYTVQGGKTEVLTLEAQQHPAATMGAAPCSIPMIATCPM